MRAGIKANCDYPESSSAIFRVALGVKYGSGLSQIAISLHGQGQPAGTQA